MIESTFTGFKVERAVASRYDSSHLSGVHTRLVIRDRNSVIAAIAAGDGESQANVDAALGAGIIWLDALQRRPHAVDRLMIFAPCGRAATIATRLTAIHLKGVTISLYEVDEATGAINPVAAYDQGDLADRLRRAARRATWPGEQPLPSDVSALVEQTVRLAPDLIESRRQGGWIKLSIRGLEFARISVARKLVEFGLGERKQRLCDENYSALEKLILDIITDRAASSDRRDELIFRAQSERWLESVIRREVTAIDPRLDARYVYSQVPIYRGDGRAFIDLLAATREGRLVVIELKVTEDAEFPFQGLDYWLRVEWHRLRGDFRRRGYFRELRLADRAPLVYLVAPLFRFHATTKLLAGSIAGRVPVYRIGINEDWRSRVRVLLSEKLN